MTSYGGAAVCVSADPKENMRQKSAYILLAVLLHCCRAQPCTNYELRLVGGQVPNEGRVEICVNQTWGTVCDDSWGDSDAEVVCRQLGYPSENADSFGSSNFGQGSGEIFLDNVGCRGMESRLIDCPVVNHNCHHEANAGVNCTPCQVGDVRLAGSSIQDRGRVEVCVNGSWGTICDDGWGSTDASVVCKQLNYSRHNATALSQAHFGQGSIPILMRNVGCSGSEEQLTNCPFNSQVASCSHSEDASVQCQINLTCRNGDIRITGGTTGQPKVGRVEVCFDETWGTVCNDHWNENDAIVACRQLGYSGQDSVALTTPGVSGYSQGTGLIFLDNVLCIGTESRLVDCPYDAHTADCRHIEDAGVQCASTCQNQDIRLIGGSSQLEGRVEVCLAGVWGTVCDDLWNDPDAAVVCKQLGFSRFGAVVSSSFHGGSGPIHLDNVQCTGSESRLVNCPYDSHTLDCTHVEDAGVVCRPSISQPSPTIKLLFMCVEGEPGNEATKLQQFCPPAEPYTVTCSNGDVRLVGGLSEFEGRVEVCWNETWGTVCDDFWDVADARVICRQLGYGSANIGSFMSAQFGQGTGSIFLDDVGCSGSEQSLVNCSHRGIGDENCGHHEDAGVRCGQCVENSVRLVGGSSQYEGRVEICLSGRWGTVCDDLWGNDDATVVCRQLGYQEQGVQALSSATFGQGTAPIIMTNVRCSGTESQLANCTYDGAPVQGCSHSEDASIRCQNVPSSPQTVSVTSLNPSSLTAQTSVGTGPFSTTIKQTPNPSQLDNRNMEAKESTSVPIPVIAGTVVTILVVVIIVIAAVLVYRKQRSKRTIHYTGDLRNHMTVVDPLPTGGMYEQPSALAAAPLATAHGGAGGSMSETVLAVNDDHLYDPIPADNNLSPVTKYENCPLPIPQESSTHMYNTTSHNTESTAKFTYDYVTTVRCVTALPETLACSKADVPRKAGDESQKAYSEGEGYSKLSVEFSQDSPEHVYNITSHGVKQGGAAISRSNYATAATVFPEEASPSSKACMNVTGDESQSQKASAEVEGYATLDAGSLPGLQYANFGPSSGAVPNPYRSLPRKFGDCTGSDSTRCEGQEDSRSEEEYMEMH